MYVLKLLAKLLGRHVNQSSSMDLHRFTPRILQHAGFHTSSRESTVFDIHAACMHYFYLVFASIFASHILIVVVWSSPIDPGRQPCGTTHTTDDPS
jgi:hypothetical protein